MAHYASYACQYAQQGFGGQQQQGLYQPQQQQQQYRLHGHSNNSPDSNAYATNGLAPSNPAASATSPNTASYQTHPQQPQSQPQAQAQGQGQQQASLAPPTSLLWSALEPWMDAEYARQVCALMRWEARVYVPPPGSDNSTSNYGNGYGTANSRYSNGAQNGVGQEALAANNAGYCVLTFASTAAAALALAQVSLFFSFVPCVFRTCVSDSLCLACLRALFPRILPSAASSPSFTPASACISSSFTSRTSSYSIFGYYTRQTVHNGALPPQPSLVSCA